MSVFTKIFKTIIMVPCYFIGLVGGLIMVIGAGIVYSCDSIINQLSEEKQITTKDQQG